MGSKQSVVDFILAQMGGEAARVYAKKMFGEYGVFRDAKMFALVCDNRLYVKPSEAARAFIGPGEEGPPYPGAKPCLIVDAERWEDGDWLCRLALVASDALPMPKPKRAKPGETVPRRTPN